MNASDPSLSILLNKHQAKRLRHYFGQGARAYQHELDLIGFKLVDATPDTYSGNRIALCPLGIETLHQHRQATITTKGPLWR